MSTSGGDSSWCVNLLKGLVLKDRDVEPTIRQSITDMAWLKFTCPRLHKACDCCCEHKSFKYMRHGQVIDMAMFEKICKSIENGHCPHIQRKPDPNKQIPSEYSEGRQLYLDRRHWYLAPRFSLRELPQCYEREIDVVDVTVSDVSILEVAAAAGNHNIVSHLLLLAGQMYVQHGLYHMHKSSCEIAARQKQTDVLQLLLSNYEPFGIRAYAHDTRFIHVHLMYLVAHGCTEGLTMLLCICENVESRPLLEQLVVSAVLYNNPAILGVLSDYFTINSSILVSGDFSISTWQLATLLGYHGCASEIQKHSTGNPELRVDLDHGSLEKVIMWVLHIDDDEYLYTFHSHMVAETLKCLSQTSIPTDMKVSEGLVEQVLKLKRMNAEVVAVMLEIIGCDVDTLISSSCSSYRGLPILCHVLRNANYETEFKSARLRVKAILNSNPSTHLHASDVIKYAHYLDFKMLGCQSTCRHRDLETSQLMKALPIDELALAALISDPRFNEMMFFVPVLFQHGFALHTSIVEATCISKYPLKRLLYQSIVSTPRTLKSRARIVLRQAYPGRRIHDFVNQTSLPVVIKKYILMIEELNRFCPS